MQGPGDGNRTAVVRGQRGHRLACRFGERKGPEGGGQEEVRKPEALRWGRHSWLPWGHSWRDEGERGPWGGHQ